MWDKEYEVKASYNNRTIYFKVEANCMAAALRMADDTACETFKEAGYSIQYWPKQSKIKVKEIEKSRVKPNEKKSD